MPSLSIICFLRPLDILSVNRQTSSIDIRALLVGKILKEHVVRDILKDKSIVLLVIPRILKLNFMIFYYEEALNALNHHNRKCFKFFSFL